MYSVKHAIFLCAMLFSQSALAETCDYRPSELIGDSATYVLETTAASVIATGSALKASGLYAFSHATTGATMLGSTAAGSSAAGTVGIIGGTGGLIGSIGAALMSPFVIIPTATIAIGVGAYEGICFFLNKDDMEK